MGTPQKLRQIRHGVGGFRKFLEGSHHRGTREKLAKEIDFAAKLLVGNGFDELLRGSASNAVEFGDLSGRGPRDFQRLALGGELRDQTNGLRARGIDAAAGEEQVSHKGVAQIPFETRNAAESGNQTQAQFRKSKARHFIRDDDVAGESQLEPAAKAHAMYRGNGHKGSGVNGIQNGVNAGEKFAHAVEALLLGQRSGSAI